MAFQLTNGRFQALTSGGVPLVGGRLYTYVSGTTTFQTTYVDAAATTPNTYTSDGSGGLYIALDARGECALWLGSGAYRFVLKDATGVNVWPNPVDGVQDPAAGIAAFGTTLAASGGSALVGFLQAGTGAVARTIQAKGRDVVNAADFGVSSDNSDNSTQLQNFINAISSSSASGAPLGILPPGTLQYATALSVPATYCNLRGAGKNQTTLKYTGTTGDGITTAALTFLKPCWSDFTIDATTSSGHAINFGNITSQVYDGALERLTLASGGDALYAPHFFSMKVDSVRAASSAGHSFRVNCGPGVTWINCYAVSAGTGKAGYRLIGDILLIGCNGVDSAERWGVFGQNTAASDGFQSDFSGVTDFARVHLIGCNIEAFSVCGVMSHNSYRYFNIEGGKIDRSALATAYESCITIKAQGIDVNTPVYLSPSFWSPGAGVANGGVGATGATIFVASGSICVMDMTGGVLGQVFDNTVLGGQLVPAVNFGVVQDVLGGRALNLNAATIGRLKANVVNFKTGSFTPVGASQVIDVTGITKAVVTPAAAASISKATFTTTVGDDTEDNGRNGTLLIEAGNGNLTVKHAGGADNFLLKGAADYPMASGEVLMLIRNAAGFWSQV